MIIGGQQLEVFVKHLLYELCIDKCFRNNVASQRQVKILNLKFMTRKKKCVFWPSQNFFLYKSTILI